MQFLVPFWLALAGAAAVPLLLHLLRRQLGTRVEFPAARLLASAQQEASARVRLRNLLLMALRVLAILLVALAAARPLADLRVGRAPRAVALVLDNSLSTGAVVRGRPVLDALRDEARRLLEAAGPQDRLWLVTVDGAVTGGDAAAVRVALDRAGVFPGRGDLPAAVTRAALLAGGAGEAAAPAVVVLTDGQATAWPGAPDVGRVPVTVVRAGGELPADRGIAAADAWPTRWSPAGEVRVRAIGREAVPVAVTLLAARGDTVARARATAEPGAILRVPLRADARGWLAGVVESPPDEWRGDDRRHVAVYVGDPPLARSDASAGPFAATALATLAANGRVRVGAGEGAVTVAAASAAPRLPAVLVAPSDGAGIAAANRALERAGIPWRFGPLVAAPARARLAPLAPGDSAPLVDVARRWRLVPAGAAAASDTLAAVGGEPWAVAGPGWVLLASPLDPAWTALPVRAAFLPWLGGVVARRLQPTGDVRAAVPGARVTPPPTATALRTPAGRTLAVAPGQPLSVPPVVGVYLWLRDDAPVGALVVDPDVEEGDVARSSEQALRAQVRGATGRGEVTVVGDGAAAARAALGGGGRRPVGGLLAGAALAVLAAEGLAGRARRVRLGAPSGAPAAARG